MRRVAVRAIVVYKDKLLLVRHKPYLRSGRVDFYCLIGGGLDEYEPFEDGLRREVMEETGKEAIIDKLIFIQQYKDKMDNLELFFLLKNSEDFLNIDLSSASHGSQEIAEIGFYDPNQVTILPKFLKDFAPNELLQIQQPILFDMYT
jgi:ADP-ribose pyrophosphatase YjhB (NUDIX family)